LGARGWEERHSPATFTYAAHAAFFAGFFPTPTMPGPHPRRFALRFAGSETTTEHTAVLDGPDIVRGLAARGYRTTCIGGVGFFNKTNPLGSVFPNMFDESHWSPRFGVTDPRSTEHQVDCAHATIAARPQGERQLLFLNVSALHQPNCHYLPGAEADSIESQAAALQYVDGALAPLWALFEARAKTFVIVCSDHGTAYGEDGHIGHRVALPVVWNVPYAELILGPR
jgi:hypothetical protein